MKTIGALMIGGLWAVIEPSTAILLTAGAALIAALVVSLRRA